MIERLQIQPALQGQAREEIVVQGVFTYQKKKFVVIKIRSYARTRGLKGVFANFEDLVVVDEMTLIAYLGFRKLGA